MAFEVAIYLCSYVFTYLTFRANSDGSNPHIHWTVSTRNDIIKLWSDSAVKEFLERNKDLERTCPGPGDETKLLGEGY